MEPDLSGLILCLMICIFCFISGYITGENYQAIHNRQELCKVISNDVDAYFECTKTNPIKLYERLKYNK